MQHISTARMRPKRPNPPKTNFPWLFTGVLYQFQLFENKQKEQSDVCQVTGHMILVSLWHKAYCINFENFNCRQISQECYG